jgi:hypothetical protein
MLLSKQASVVTHDRLPKRFRHEHGNGVADVPRHRRQAPVEHEILGESL